jgi:hypothetical protein
MAVDAGQVVQGTVVRLLNYGVLVRLDDGSTGLVHISEIDQNYVRDVADYFQVNDPVNVKCWLRRARTHRAFGEAGAGRRRDTAATPASDGDAPREPRPAPDAMSAAGAAHVVNRALLSRKRWAISCVRAANAWAI